MNLGANGEEKRSTRNGMTGWALGTILTHGAGPARGAGLAFGVGLALLTMAAAPLTAQMSDATAKQLREKIRAALFVPEPLPDLDAKNFGSFIVEPGVVAERVTYATEYGAKGSGDRVPAGENARQDSGNRGGERSRG
jgi:hypothetical protein